MNNNAIVIKRITYTSFIFFVIFISSACAKVSGGPVSLISIPVELRVMSYNIGDFSGVGFENGSEESAVILREAISEQKASIIGLQEDVDKYGDHCPNDVIYRYPFYYREGNTTFNNKAFASVFPISNIRKVNYEGGYFDHSFFLAGDLLLNDSRVLLLVSFHFDWSDKNRRQHQIYQLINYSLLYKVVILMGDTNCDNYIDYSKIDDSSLFNEEWVLFKNNGYSMANNGCFGIFPTYISGKTLDNIFVKGCTKMNSFYVKKDYMNDHYMVLADIRID